MHSREELCNKIREVFPDIGACGIDVKVDFDRAKNVWVVDLLKDKHHLKTYMEIPEADSCMEGKQCVSLGLQIGELRKNLGMLH